MGLWDNVASWLYDEIRQSGAIEEAADEGYNAAMDACGNEGQVSIIDMTGYDAFVEAAEVCVNGGDPYGVLLGACPYPEAVSLILMDAAGVIEEVIEEASGEILDSDTGDDAEDELDDDIGDS